jgi:hypothetical protein
MVGIGKGILDYETTLPEDAQARLREIGEADLVIGIPSHRNGRTIAEVVSAVAEGVSSYLGDRRVVLMNADGGSSDNTVRCVVEAEMPGNVEKLIVPYVGVMGKGTAIRAILEATAHLEAAACLVIEARAVGITPAWLPALITPIDEGDDLVWGRSQRSATAAALSENLAYPFVSAFFGADLEDPLSGEFCLAGDLAGELAGRDVWETDVCRYGVNIWLSMHALLEDMAVAQVDLGYCGEAGGEAGTLGDPRFLHTAGTMFRFLTTHQRLWAKGGTRRDIPWRGGRYPDRQVPSREGGGALLEGLRAGEREYGGEWQRILTAPTLAAVRALWPSLVAGNDFPDELWARVALECAVVYNKGEGDPDKVIEALLPLYYGRAAAFLARTQEQTCAERWQAAQRLAAAFQATKPFVTELWNDEQLWIDDRERLP